MITDKNLINTELKLTAGAVIELYEWCRDRLDKKICDPVVGIAISVNEMLLSGPYREIVSKMWTPQLDPAWDKWVAAERGCREKWADRNNNGEIVRGYGEPIITENLIEFEKELSALKASEEFAPLWKKIETAAEENEAVKRTVVRTRVCCIDSLDRCPEDVTPRVMAALYGNTVYELLKVGRD